MKHLFCHFLILVSSVLSLSAAKPMNVLILFADDWRYDTLGVAGNEVVQTPELDKLSTQGIRFTDNYVTTSICGVSRASLFTGQWMSRHGNIGIDMFKTPWSETYPGILRDNGYWVGHVGKWHNGDFPKENFDYGIRTPSRHWLKQKDGSKIHVTAKHEMESLNFLRTRPKDKPFCLTVAFFATHAQDGHPKQYLPQPQSMELYTDVTIPVPVNATQESWERLPDFFTDRNEGRNRWRWRFDTPEKYQEMMKNYYRLASEVDATCGRLIDELREQGVLENTLVIFTTDNGYFHAEHGLADKWYPHQESIRVPLIIRDPRMKDELEGSTNDAMTLNVDLAATILAATGMKQPEGMQGEDIAVLYLSEDRPKWREEYFYEHGTRRNKYFIPSSQALVRKDYKYMFWPEFNVEQLFDLKSDPIEESDLIDDPDQAERLKEMRARFAELKIAAK